MELTFLFLLVTVRAVNTATPDSFTSVTAEEVTTDDAVTGDEIDDSITNSTSTGTTLSEEYVFDDQSLISGLSTIQSDPNEDDVRGRCHCITVYRNSFCDLYFVVCRK